MWQLINIARNKGDLYQKPFFNIFLVPSIFINFSKKKQHYNKTSWQKISIFEEQIFCISLLISIYSNHFESGSYYNLYFFWENLSEKSLLYSFPQKTVSQIAKENKFCLMIISLKTRISILYIILSWLIKNRL